MLQSFFWNSNVTNQNNQASLSSKMYDGRLHISPAERLHVDTADSLKMRACIGVPRWQQRKPSELTPSSICTCRANQHSDVVLTGSAATGWEGWGEVTGGGSGGVDNKTMKWMPCRGPMPAMSESKLPLFRLEACTNRDHCAQRQFAQRVWFNASLQQLHYLCESDLGAVQSYNVPCESSYGVSICLSMWLKSSLHLSRVCHSHPMSWRDQFSRCMLEEPFWKDAFKINSELVCTQCRGFVRK